MRGTGKFRLLKIAMLAMILGIFVTMLPRTALAFNLSARNDTEQPLTFAIMYYDDGVEDWLCRGWFSIPANTIKKYEFPDTEQVDQAYLYAQGSGGLIWSARQNEGKAATVIREAFTYYRGSSTPSGSNKRTVYFKAYNFNDSGNIVVRWTGGQG